MKATDIPSIFTIPEDFLHSLPSEIQKWLTSVESRIDGMTHKRIKKEAKEVAGSVGDPEKIYRLGRRLFYRRIQEIFDIMFPDSGLEVGIDLLCNPCDYDIPGAVIDQILHNEEPDNSDVLEKCGIPTLSSLPIRSRRAELEEAAV